MSTYQPIASITLASAASSVTFSGIPQTYTDLVIIANAQSETAGSGANFLNARFNSDTGSNYSQTYIYPDGSSVASGRDTNQTMMGIGEMTQTSSTQLASNIIQIMNYSNTTTNKTVLIRAGYATSSEALVGLWRSTAAITSISLARAFGATNIKAGSSFHLYGIANASITNVAKATGGDSVYTDGTYWYHIFRSSGTFTPTQALTADYLVVAGGGGGGFYGAGGGAGGLRCTVTATGGGGSLESALSLTASTNYTVTVGAGGSAGASTASNGTNGSDSVFSTITSTGGGYGTSSQYPSVGNGANGGSGGGAAPGSGNNNASGTGGTGTANQGYAGGGGWIGASNGYSGFGGGGGAGAVGASATTSTTGNGGNGVATSISGSSVTYAGGGGGGKDSRGTNSDGNGGSGGGGNGNTTAGSAGTANTGGGGGGGGFNGTNTAAGGAGGSGIVVIRYSAAA